MVRLIVHSAKGSEWEDHKYVKKVDGNYYYPNGYGKGREISDLDGGGSSGENKKVETNADLSGDDVETFAQDVIRGVFGNGQVRKDLLGENYQKIQDRVNEILKNKSVSDMKLSDAAGTDVEKAGKEALKKAASTAAGMNMDVVYAVYGDTDSKSTKSTTTKRAKRR